jgi:cbb3-type cytochrome oxidase subunit 1
MLLVAFLPSFLFYLIRLDETHFWCDITGLCLFVAAYYSTTLMCGLSIYPAVERYWVILQHLL